MGMLHQPSFSALPTQPPPPLQWVRAQPLVVGRSHLPLSYARGFERPVPRRQRIHRRVEWFHGHSDYDEVCLRQGYYIPQPVRYTTRDWYRVLLAWPASQVMRRIWPPVTTLTAWAVLITMLQMVVPFQQLTLTAHSLVGTALGLLLVFRTNSANDRFWEGRKMWEQVVNSSREIASLCGCYVKYMGIARVRKVCRLLCAFAVSLTEYLVGPKKRAQMVQSFQYTAEEEVLINASSSPPYRIAQILLVEFSTVPDSKDGMFTNRERAMMKALVFKLMKTVAQGERLVQTPIPQSYVRHTSRFLTLWLATLPFGLSQVAGWWCPPIVWAASWALIGIQDLGQGIEHPFDGPQSLPMQVMCNTVRDSVADALHTVSLSDSSNFDYIRDVLKKLDSGGKVPVEAHVNGYKTDVNGYKTEVIATGR